MAGHFSRLHMGEHLMNRMKTLRVYCALFMAVIMTNIPHIAWADAAKQMIPTYVVIDEISVTEARAKVNSFFDREDFKAELIKRGVQPDEVQARLGSLNEQELRVLATQMDKAQYGGDVGGILIIVVLVLLIIFLARRI